MNKKKLIVLIFLLLIQFFFIYFHSFGSNYPYLLGSGDSYRVVLNSYEIADGQIPYLLSFSLVILSKVMGVEIGKVHVFFMPLVGLLITFLIYLFLWKFLRYFSLLPLLFLITNPWITYNYSEPEKAIFVMFFFFCAILSLSFFFEKKSIKFLFLTELFLVIGTLFYHSGFFFFLGLNLFLFFKFFWAFYKKENLFFLRYMIIIFCCILLLSSFYIPKVFFSQEKVFYNDVEIASTHLSDKNTIIRTIEGMFKAILTTPEKLGFKDINVGLEKFLNIQFPFVMILFLLIFVLFFSQKQFAKEIGFLLFFVYSLLSIIWTSSSHSSRYPLYVVYFVYILLGYVFFSLFKKSSKRSIAFFLFLFSLLITTSSFTYSNIENMRSLYQPHFVLNSLLQNGSLEINSSNQLLYLSWPSLTIQLRNNDVETSYLHQFGWGLRNLTILSSKEYILSNNITYYLHVNTGEDYYDSANVVRGSLEKHFVLKPLYEGKGKKIILYKIIPTQIKIEKS